MVVLIDNGHGSNTPGKRSPLFDKEWQTKYGMDRLYEYDYCRKVAAALAERINKTRGNKAILVTPERADISITNRVARVNSYCSKYGTMNCLCVCIHLDAAAGNGWYNASGYTGYIAKMASQNSRSLAKYFESNAVALKMRGNRKTAATIERDLGIVKSTKCPAILTESAFQNNKTQVAWLLTEEGFEKVVKLHYDSIMQYIDVCSK